MYQVSQAYIDKILSVGAKRRYISGTLDGTSFDENDVVLNSLKYSKQAVGSNDIKLGGVFLGTLELTFTKEFTASIARGTWDKKVIDLSIGLEIAPNNIEFVPIGVYEVNEADHVAEGVKIVAYDKMYHFDKNLNLTSTSGSLFSFLTFCCNKCHVELGMNREEVEALPNGQEVISVYPENDMSTYRDFISWIAVTACCFATMTRDGKLILVSWKSQPVFILGINDRFTGGSFSDFVTRYTGASFGNIADETIEYIHVLPDNGLSMAIGMNPLLQYGLPDVKSRMRQAILNALQEFEYTPFKVKAFADPCFDLGDILKFTGGLAGTEIFSCIMRMDFSFTGGMTLQGFGKNPSMFGAQSKTDKDISGLMQKSQGMETKYEVYTNSDDLDITREENSNHYMDNVIDICTLTFACNKDSTVEINTTCLVNIEFYTTYPNTVIPYIDKVFVNFYVDEEKVSHWKYRPLQLTYGALQGEEKYYRIGDGFLPTIPVEHFFPLLNVKAGEIHTLRVELDYRAAQGRYVANEDRFYSRNMVGTADIKAGDLVVTLKGQGLVVEKPWDGFIRAEDSVSLQKFGYIRAKELDETAEITLVTPVILNPSDMVRKQKYGCMSLPEINEAVAITMHRPKRNIISIRSGNLTNISKTENIITI